MGLLPHSRTIASVERDGIHHPEDSDQDNKIEKLAHASDGNLGGGRFANADRWPRPPEILDDVQNSTAALAKEVVPFTTCRDR